jgi:DNA end-binding protein Ku
MSHPPITLKVWRGLEEKMASSVWKGSLSFGLLTIPIRLYPAARSERMNLHQIHRVCHTRLKQPLFCPTCNRIVERSEVIKGFEHEDSKYVLLENDELKKIVPRSGRMMEIAAFVKADQIDPIYFESSYFALPEKDNEKPYVLLLKALEDTERVGIATVTMHQREYTVFIRPRGGGLTVHTMYFPSEIRKVEGYGKIDKDIKLKPQEIKLAEQLVESLSEDFQPQKYRDTFQENLKALIAAKQQGKTIVEEQKMRRAPVIDMMEALKRSVRASEAAHKGRSQAKPPVRHAETERRRRLAS